MFILVGLAALMSAIARIMLELGYHVTGSDLKPRLQAKAGSLRGNMLPGARGKT